MVQGGKRVVEDIRPLAKLGIVDWAAGYSGFNGLGSFIYTAVASEQPAAISLWFSSQRFFPGPGAPLPGW